MKKRKNRNTVWLLTVFSLFVFILAGCGNSNSNEPAATSGDSSEQASPSETAKPVPVNLQLKWVPQAQFAGYYVAMDKGYYTEEGLKVEILPGGPDIVPEQQVASGAADIGVGWVASLLAHQEQGLPLVEISQIYQKSGLVLVAKKQSGITSAADLKGKKVGNWMGGNEFEILALFEKYKLNPSADLDFIKQGFTMDQFLAGELDAASAMTYNEYQVVLEQGISEAELSVIDMNAEGVAMLEDNLFANKDWLAENKETAAKFVRASLRGWKDAIDNPEAAVDIVMKEAEGGSTTRDHQLNMMKEVIKLVAPEGFDKEKIGVIDDALFKQTAEIAFQFGVVKKAVNLAEAYTNEIVEMAKK